MTDKNGGIDNESRNQTTGPGDGVNNRSGEGIAKKLVGTAGRVQLRSDAVLQGVRNKMDRRWWWLIGGVGLVV